MSQTQSPTSELVAGAAAGESREWNWHPSLPIETSPVFKALPRPFASLKWYADAWLPLSELALYVLLAWAVWAWVQPDPLATQALAPGWIAAVWLRNIALMTVFATFLHLWLYTWKKQGDALRYDRRGPTATARVFAFGSQLWDNVAYALISGVTIWTLYEVGLWWGYANDALPMVTLAENPVWFVLWFPLIGIWYSCHFYWVHRLLHWAPLYRRVHSVHHRNIAVGPWSGFSMHPVEHTIYLSSLLIHLVVPSHPVHMLFHAYWLTLATATSHSGYDALIIGKSGRIDMGTFFHQLHHRYFECNYGTAEMPWDRWFGSFHDGTAEGLKRVRARKKPISLKK